MTKQASFFDSNNGAGNIVPRLDRYSGQQVITKLDTNAISLKEAREFLAKLGISLAARTKESACREIAQLMAR